MGECEFLNKWNICTICRFAPDKFDECHALKDFRKLFDSPQFKKQYANREELVGELHRWEIEYRERTGRDTLPLGEVFAVVLNHGIRTHGKEE